jgi:hypothetical protein
VPNLIYVCNFYLTAEVLVPEELRRSAEAKTQAEILEDKNKIPSPWLCW